MLRFLIINGNLSAVVTGFLLSLIVIFHNIKSPIKKWFVAENLCIALWCVGAFVINLIPQYTIALYAHRFCYIFGVLVVPASIEFAYATIGIQTPLKTRLIWLSLSVALIAFLPTPFFMKGLNHVTEFGLTLRQSGPGIVYYLFAVFLNVSCIKVLYMLFNAARKSQGSMHNRFLFIFIGYGIYYLAGGIYFATIFHILPIFSPAGYVVSLGMIIFFYAILKHRLMDIHVVIRWSTVVSAMAVVLTSLYVTGVVFVTKYLNMDIFGIRLLVIAFILSTLVVFHRTIKHMIEGVMLIREKDEKEELNELYQNLATTLDLKEIKWVVISELESIFRTRCVTLVLFDLKERRFKVYASVGYEEIEKVRVTKESPLVTWLMNNNRPAVYDWLDAEREEDKKVQDVMDELNMTVAMVLAHNDTMVGMLGLAEKKRRRYTADEIVLFAEFCGKMAVPFTNAVKYRLNVGQDDEDEQGGKLPFIPLPPNLNEPGKPKIYFRGVEVKDDPKDPYSVYVGPLHAVNRKWDWIKMRDRYDPSTKEIRLGEDEEKKDDGGDDGGKDAS